jgi:hypothetical protein
MILSRVVPLAMAVLLMGCVTRSADVEPKTSVTSYAALSCEQLHDDMADVRKRAEIAAYDVDARVGDNIVALGLGLTAFWPALVVMRSGNDGAERLARLKGEHAAMATAFEARSCAEPPDQMPADRRAALPLGQGDRLIYEQRAQGKEPARVMALELSRLRRDALEFVVEIDGVKQPTILRQDLAGNPLLAPRPPLMAWQYLLPPDLTLGQGVAGGLAAADEAVPQARLNGRVVSVGGKGVAGRDFDVTVIELHGVAPLQEAGRYDLAQANTVVDGVIAIDRKSGVLLRLDLNCANPAYAAHWRLIRVDSPAH